VDISVVGVMDEQYVVHVSEVSYDVVFDKCVMCVCSMCCGKNSAKRPQVGAPTP
jgi:hypothetical protein